MATRNRARTPTHLRIVKGNPGKRALPKNEPKPAGNLVDPPDGLTEEQQACWRYAIECAPWGLLKRLDRSVLMVWVVAHCLHEEARKKLASSQMLIRTPNGMPQQSPYIGIMNRQAVIMLKAAAEMGFTPASRSRVEMDSEPEEDSNDFF